MLQRALLPFFVPENDFAVKSGFSCRFARTGSVAVAIAGSVRTRRCRRESVAMHPEGKRGTGRKREFGPLARGFFVGGCEQPPRTRGKLGAPHEASGGNGR